MSLFGRGSKRDPVPQPIALRAEPGVDVPTTSSCSKENVAGAGGPFAAARQDRLSMPTPRPSVHQRADVEVVELNLSDDEFLSTFGAGESQFSDTCFGGDDADDDPWASRRRLA